MALDYLMARTGGACVTLIPDNSDNIPSVITALEKIRDVFGPSDPAGFSFSEWLSDKLGPWGAMLVRF